MNEIAPMATPDRLRILAADLSLCCPGFAVLQYEDGKVSIERLCHLDNRRSKAAYGEILCAIYDLIAELSSGIDVFVRERAFSRFPHETQALFRVVGISDLAVWKLRKAIWEELAPTSVKKLLTGSGKADKMEVAAA